MITLEQLLSMSKREHRDLVFQANSFDIDDVVGCGYTGVDLSLPPLMNRILWKTFRKTFHQDADNGIVRGWNERVEQTGWDTPTTPLRKADGSRVTFGHYHLKAADRACLHGRMAGRLLPRLSICRESDLALDTNTLLSAGRS